MTQRRLCADGYLSWLRPGISHHLPVCHQCPAGGPILCTAQAHPIPFISSGPLSLKKDWPISRKSPGSSTDPRTTGKHLQAAFNRSTLRPFRFLPTFQRSYSICWAIQLWGVVSKAIESRRAISGDMPVWPFKSSDSAFRLTPSALAAPEIDRPSGFRQSSRIISPGCGGLCIILLSP
jgi:hypothetical protein